MSLLTSTIPKNVNKINGDASGVSPQNIFETRAQGAL